MQSIEAKYSNKSFVQILVLISIFLIAFTGKSAQGACIEYEWDCGDGQCIDKDTLCDGAVNCNNGSDEIAENCSDISCASFGFRCNYGACIAGNAKCNNKKDCADNSDESPILCGR